MKAPQEIHAPAPAQTIQSVAQEVQDWYRDRTKQCQSASSHKKTDLYGLVGMTKETCYKRREQAKQKLSAFELWPERTQHETWLRRHLAAHRAYDKREAEYQARVSAREKSEA